MPAAVNNQMPQRLGLVLFALWLVVFASMSQTLIVAAILPRIGEQFGATSGQLGWVLTSYALPLALSTMIAGPVSDRVGRRKILVVGAAALAVALLLHGFVTNFAQFLGIRFIAGLCGGVLSGGAFAYVGDAIPANRRGWATGWVNTGFAAGQVLSIPIGSLLAVKFGVLLPFTIFGVLMALACVLVIAVVPQPPVVRSAALSPASVARSYRALLSNRHSRGACWVYAALFSAIGVFVPYLPVFLETAAGLSTVAVSLVFAAGGATMVLVSPRIGALSDRLGRRPVAILGSAGVGVLMLAMISAPAWPPLAYVIFALMMACASSRSGALRTLVSELVNADQRGTLIYVTLALGQFGFAAGSAIAGTVYSLFGFTGNALFGAIASVGMALLIVRLLPETLNTDAPTAAASGPIISSK